MQLFYTPDITNEKSYTLSESESKHAVRVLRLKNSDTITLIDGKGTFYNTIIVNDNPKKCEVSITNTNKESTLKPTLHIAIAPTKNNDRTEWFVEKCTEIGINQITPMLCKHSERKKIKLERYVKTAVSAMKQSLKATLPILCELTKFSDVVNQSFQEKKYIAHCYNEKQKHFKDILQKRENSLILIGPEGDFSQEEIALAIEKGFEPITFGASRLRTETAGVVACTIFNLMNE
ncbi:MAG: 16S rRNA (uracil(1498)-N(3))-methyltransferase [Flavobacteriales bacterium]|nr:MAG: 16S rRNA (uracil(1498)-N(3))-methyltransferase [Flavobacteriales bacterium]